MLVNIKNIKNVIKNDYINKINSILEENKWLRLIKIGNIVNDIYHFMEITN